MKRSLIEKTLPVAAGGVSFLIIDNVTGASAAAALIPTVMLIVAAAGCFGRRKVFFHRAWAVLLGAALFGLSSFTAEIIDRAAWSGIYPGKVETMQIFLTSDPSPLGKGRWIAAGYLTSVESSHLRSDARGRITVFGGGSLPVGGMGMYVTARGVLTTSAARSGRTPFTVSADSILEGPWAAKPFEFRYRMIHHISQRLNRMDVDTANFLSALLLGRKTDTGSALMKRFRDAGCMHLLALSGFHIGLIALAIRFLSLPVLGYRAASCLSALGAAAFLFLAGPRPSLVRAVLMYLFWTLDNFRGHKNSAWMYLACAFVIQTTLCPWVKDSVSFLLSYAALAGLLGPGAAWMRLLKRRLPPIVSGVLGAGFGAQSATLPIVCSTFGIWRPIGLAAAPILTPMVAWTMAAGAAAVMAGDTGAALLLYRLLDKLFWIMEAVSERLSLVPGIVLQAPFPWLITAMGTILPIILTRRIRHEKTSLCEPRLPSLNPRIPGKSGFGTSKEVGTKFSHQQWSQGKNNQTPRHRIRAQYMGNRPRPGSHEPKHPGDRIASDGL